MVSRSDEFVCRGDVARELWGWMSGTRKPPLEVLCEGPAGTGKTRTILEFIRSYVEMYDGVRVLIMRDRRVDMSSTVLVEFENEVLGSGHPAVMNGPSREHREKYVFPNGSEIVLGGFNNETKLFSGQYNGIYFNECQETIERKWETLHRALRAKGGPFRFFIGDCNPEEESHWMNQRCERGVTMRLRSKLWDNPRFFRSGEWTDDGSEYLNRLQTSLSGHNYDRLYLGLWTSATGRIWPEYDPDIHLVYGTLSKENDVWYVTVNGKKTELRWFVLSKDVGYSPSPGVLQAWGVDISGVMYRVEEWYRLEWTHAQWAKKAVELSRKYHPQALVCDHDNALIAAINRSLVDAGMSPIARLADKAVGKSGRKGKMARIEMMRSRFSERRIFFLRDAILEPDPRLQLDGRPDRTEKEIPKYVRNQFVRGEDNMERAEDPDPTCDDHGIDATMYGDAYVWGRTVDRIVPTVYEPGTFGHIFRTHAKRGLGPSSEVKPLWR